MEACTMRLLFSESFHDLFLIRQVSLTTILHRRWVVVLAGEAVVSLPNSTQTATIPGGRNGLILAADIKNASTYGHITVYPNKKETIVMQIPTADNVIPPHSVLHDGPCAKSEKNTGG